VAELMFTFVSPEVATTTAVYKQQGGDRISCKQGTENWVSHKNVS